MFGKLNLFVAVSASVLSGRQSKSSARGILSLGVGVALRVLGSGFWGCDLLPFAECESSSELACLGRLVDTWNIMYYCMDGLVSVCVAELWTAP